MAGYTTSGFTASGFTVDIGITGPQSIQGQTVRKNDPIKTIQVLDNTQTSRKNDYIKTVQKHTNTKTIKRSS